MTIASTITETETPNGPIEVWLSQPVIEITCTLVADDESTANLDITSLSMRGAQREITGYLIGIGYEPAGRWETEGGSDVLEVSRKFRPATAK